MTKKKLSLTFLLDPHLCIPITCFPFLMINGYLEIKKNTKIENNQISHLEYDFLPSQKVKSIGRCFYVVS